MISHTPPAFSVGSLDPLMKRARSGSISKRLRNAADMAEETQLDKESQGALKDMIIADDPRLQRAMQRIEEGDPNVLKEMLADGTLAAARKNSIDLMGDYGDLNFDFLNVGGSAGGGSGFMDNEDQFELAFGEDDATTPPLPLQQSGQLQHQQTTQRDGQQHARQPYQQQQGSQGSQGIKSEPVSIRSSGRGQHQKPDIRPLPVKGHSGSFGQPLPELFEFNLFDEMGGGAGNVSFSPMSHSPSRSMGSVGMVGSQPQQRRLHRDSIAQLDDLLLSRDDSRSYGSVGGASLVGSDQATSAPIGIPLRGRRASAGKGSLENDGDEEDGDGDGDSQLQRAKGRGGPSVRGGGGGAGRGRGGRAATTRHGAPRPPHTGSTARVGAGAATAASAAGGTRIKSEAAAAEAPRPPHHRAETSLGPAGYTGMDLGSTASGQTGYIGGYSPDSRRRRIEKFLQKRQNRVWKKRVKYDVRKNFADSRLRVKGRFVKKEDEELLRELIVMTL